MFLIQLIEFVRAFDVFYMIEREIRGNIAICSLNRGITNALNAKMVQSIKNEFDELKDKPDIGGVILRSSNFNFYSIGLDIPELFPLSREEFTKFFQSFTELCVEILKFPKPVVTMLSGHTMFLPPSRCRRYFWALKTQTHLLL